jgi:DNA-binding response OmpR family regulator
MTAGYAVVGAANGIDALRRIDSETPNAIVLDLALPLLHGIDVQREIRADVRTRHIPIVVVTGTDLAAAHETDFDCVLRKPIDPDSLVRAVESCLRKEAGSRPASSEQP